MIQDLRGSLKYFKLKALRMSLYSKHITYILKMPTQNQYFMVENVLRYSNIYRYYVIIKL